MIRVRSYQMVKEPSFMQFFPDRCQDVVALVMGDCHSRAVTRRPAVAHAGGVKIYAFPLHVYVLWPLESLLAL